jgi:hypothetical protein
MDEVDPFDLRRRVVGSRPRGWALIGTGLLLVAVLFLLLNASEKSSPSAVSTLAGTLVSLVAMLAVALGVVELRRPMLADRHGVLRNPRIESAELRWHPKDSEIPGGLDCKLKSFAGTRTQGLATTMMGSARARVLFDDPPFRVGTTARMRFKAWTTGIDFDAPSVEFVLRCIRE